MKKNLMVFIHPVVVKSGDTAEKISSDNYQRMQSLRKQYAEGKLDSEGGEFTEFIPRKKIPTDKQ